jgi:23S rRNA (guanosine2251-2'-O)-methyltransferase
MNAPAQKKRVVYGVNPVAEALRSSSDRVEKIMLGPERGGKAVFDIIKAAEEKNITIERAGAEELSRLAGTPKHQGVVAVLYGEFRYSDIEDLIGVWKRSETPAFFLMLDSIQDPQNLGSLIRSANAAGVHGVIIPRDRACEVTPAAVKASAGATEHTPVAMVVNLVRAIERLKEEGVWVAGVETGGDDLYKSDLDRDLALVIGSEGKGIRRLVKEACDFVVTIPMAGKINSLNAAQAGAIAMFEAKRQRKKP